MSIGLKSDSSGTSGSIVINGSDAVLVTPTGITTASIQDSSITFAKLSTSATEANNVAKRVAKAWVNFNGTGTPAIRDDFNVSSITDNAIGTYTVNFSTALPDTNYVFAGNGGSGSSGTLDSVIEEAYGADYLKSTSQFKIYVVNGAFSLADRENVYVLFLSA